MLNYNCDKKWGSGAGKPRTLKSGGLDPSNLKFTPMSGASSGSKIGVDNKRSHESSRLWGSLHSIFTPHYKWGLWGELFPFQKKLKFSC